MKNILAIVASVLLVAVIIFSLYAVAFGGYAIFYPKMLGVQREAVEQSKSYVDASNIAIASYIAEWESLEAEKLSSDADADAAYSNQQDSILFLICARYGAMKPETVSTTNQRWIARKGNCQ